MKFPARYTFLRDLKPGGMSTVAVYKDVHLDREVVIKIVAPGAQYKRAADEIAALERIRSDYVVDVYDVLVDPTTREVGIVEACLGGVDLADTPVSTLADQQLRLQVLYQLADALREVHGANVIHRDVKPENIRLVDGRRLILFDFGLARDSNTGNYTAGFVGSVAYAAPELFAAGYVQFTTAVDIYALGAVAYFLINGRGLPPIAQRVTHPTPHIVDGHFSARTTAILNRALSINAVDRPTAEDLCKVLAAELLHDQHRALLIGASQSRVLSAQSRTATMRAADCELRVEYDGDDFTVTAVDGEVFSNNDRLVIGSKLKGCSVLTFGTGGSSRTFATFDVANPEVLIQ